MNELIQRISVRRLIFYLVSIGAIALVYVKFSELKLIQSFFHRSNWIYLVGVVVIQVIFFFVQAANYQAVLRIKGLRVGVWELFPIGYVVQFISQAVPTAGISGQIFFIQYLKKYGLTIAEGIGRAILELATLYVAYGAFFAASALLLFRKDVFQKDPRFLLFIYAFLAFFILIFGIIGLSKARRRSAWFQWILTRVPKYFRAGEMLDIVKAQVRETLSVATIRRHLWLFILACFLQAALLFSHVITLYLISIAIGYKIPLAASFVAFTFSKLLSMISVVPGAPGVFEGAMTLILITFGVDKSVALAATLLLRGFTFWLPMPIGWMIYGKYLRRFELNEAENDNLAVS